MAGVGNHLVQEPGPERRLAWGCDAEQDIKVGCYDLAHEPFPVPTGKGVPPWNKRSYKVILKLHLIPCSNGIVDILAALEHLSLYPAQMLCPVRSAYSVDVIYSEKNCPLHS